MRKRLRTLTIDRTKWGRNNSAGERSGGSLLLCSGQTDKSSDVGKMCCLGFACEKLQIDKDEMIDKRSINKFGIGMPESLPANVKDIMPLWLIKPECNKAENPTDVDNLAHINDSPYLSDAEKEVQITAIFAKHGVKVKFIN